MCGIAAIFAYGSSAKSVNSAELMRIREAMVSRGPDSDGFWVAANKNIGLAHRRLAILDLTTDGGQPMAAPDGKLRIVFNGEIYNYRELREQLKAKGHQFKSSGDTEVLLCAYRQYGADMVHHLRGMFAFAIWDEERRGLFLARDHFGIKPLYYHDDGSFFRVASQVKAMIVGRGFLTEPEPAGHVGFFLWGSVPEPFTLYKDLFSLPAGHSLWVDDNGPRVPQCFFDVAEELVIASNQTTQCISVKEAFQEALRDSMQHHLIADVSVGVFLSSGVDSGSLMALASESTPHISAITLGFKEYEGTARDEAPLARELAQRYDCNHYIEQITQRDFDRALPNILASMDQPSTDGVNTWFVAQAAAKAGLKVALSGLGGDEFLGGYPGFSQIPKLVSLARLPARVPIFGKGFRVLSASVMKNMISPKYAGIFEYGGSYAGAYLLRRSLFMPWELPKILDPDLVREGWASLQPVIRMEDKISRLSTSHGRISTLELTQYMRNTLLRDSDWAGMAHSLEIRTPLVDIEVFRALAPFISGNGKLPSKQDMAQTPTKSLPSEVVNRPKTGFSIPVQKWIEESGSSKEERGLRGWASRVYKTFEHAI